MAPPRRARAPTRAHAAAPSSGRSTAAWCAERGSSSLLPLLLAAFTVGRPQPLPAPTLPPAFDGATAEQLARELARDYPDRAARIGRRASAPPTGSRNSWLSTASESQTDRFRASIPGRGRVELQNIVAVVPGDSPTRNRDRRTPRQQRRGARRQRQRLGHGRADRARARVRARAGARRCNRARPTRSSSSPPTAARSAPSARPVRASTRPTASDALAVVSLDAIAGVGPPRLRHRRRHGPFAGRCARANRRGAGARADRSRAGAFVRPPPAARPRLSVHLRRAGAVRRAGIPAVTLTTVPDAPSQVFEDDPLERRAPGRARPRDPEPRRLARRRPRAAPGNDELRLPRSAIRAGLDDRARAPDGALPRSRSGRSISSPAAGGGAFASVPPCAACRSRLLFWGYARPAALRRRQARGVPGRRAATAPRRPRPLPARAGGRSRVLGLLLLGRLARRPRAPDSAPAGTSRGSDRRSHGRAARARPRRARGRRDEPVLAHLPAPVALRLALAAAGARRAPDRALHAPRVGFAGPLS